MMLPIPRRRRGATLLLATTFMLVLLGFIAFGVDAGIIALARTNLQVTADAAAAAAAGEVLRGGHPEASHGAGRDVAKTIAAQHRVMGVAVTLNDADVEFGRWNTATRTFTAGQTPTNAVRVWGRRNSGNPRGPITLAFARVLGMQSADVQVNSIALFHFGTGTRFLVDDEMIDTDVPAIQNVAARAGRSTEDVISDRDGDWFIDLHKYVSPGERLELPTGQVGDEGLLDISVNDGTLLSKFPFSETSTPSHADFLNYNEDSNSWRYSLIDKSRLDPLSGVGRFNQPGKYPALVNPEFIHVSPVYKSDSSALDGVLSALAGAGPDINGDGIGDGLTTNADVLKGVNALGWRRGLIAFKIVGYRIDPARTYPYLPNLLIELVDPATVSIGGARVYRLGKVIGSVRMAN